MTREFGEGERNERREDEMDELEELRDRVRARGERLGEAGQERNELDEFASYVEHLRMKYGPEGGAKPSAVAPEQRDRTQDELDVGAYQNEENDDGLEQQPATSETRREGLSGPPERANDSAEGADPARVEASPKLREMRREGEKRLDQAGVE